MTNLIQLTLTHDEAAYIASLVAQALPGPETLADAATCAGLHRIVLGETGCAELLTKMVVLCNALYT